MQYKFNNPYKGLLMRSERLGEFIVQLNFSQIAAAFDNTPTVYSKHREWIEYELEIEKAKHPEEELYIIFQNIPTVYVGKFNESLLDKVKQRDDVEFVTQVSDYTPSKHKID